MKYYLLLCKECAIEASLKAEPDSPLPLPIPFASQAERGEWASKHTRGTGHDKWLVLEQETQDPPEEPTGPTPIPGLITPGQIPNHPIGEAGPW
jgi:hypothetical protein